MDSVVICDTIIQLSSLALKQSCQKRLMKVGLQFITIVYNVSWILNIVRELYHFSTMVIHLGHIFISFILMLYGPKLGCVGQAWFLWCFGLIYTPKHPHLIIMVTHSPSFMTI